MTHDSESNYVPRAPRFEVTDASEAVVTLTRIEGADHESFSAKLVDVSQHGTKLLVPENLRFQEAVQLRIEIQNTELDYHGIASVRHIRAVEQKSRANEAEHCWVIGCAIDPPFTDETFAYLATTAGKERRRSRRVPIAAEASIRRQTQTTGDAATLLNLSAGGFSFLSTVEYGTGEKVQVDIEDTDGELRVIPATVCWQVETSEGWLAGCQFASPSSYAAICACLTEQPASALVYKQPADPTSKLVLVAAVLAMFVPPMMTLMLTANNVSANAVSTDSAEDTVAAETNHALPQRETPSKELLAAASQALIASETPEEVPAPREWVDNTGKFRVQATLLEATPEHVVLEKSDGKRKTVPWRRLSAADQRYLESWLER